MAGHTEHTPRYSPDVLSQAQSLAHELSDLAAVGRLLTRDEWAAFASRLPGAAAAGEFVEHIQKANTLRSVGMTAPFLLVRAIWHDVTRRDTDGLFPVEIMPRANAGAREVLLALIGGHIYETARQQGIPLFAGEFMQQKHATAPRSLQKVFENTQLLPGSLYSSRVMPRSYKRLITDFRRDIRAMRDDDVTEIIKAFATQGVTDRVKQHDLSWEVLLERHLARLLQPSEIAMPQLTSADSHIVDTSIGS